MRLGKSLMALVLFSSLVMATVYENAEDGTTNRWSIYTNTSGTASITNVVDGTTGSKVIEFTASNMSDGFKIGNIEDEPNDWTNTFEKKLKWDFKYNNRSSMYVRVDTSDGPKFLYYGFGIADELSLNGRYIRHNLGDRPSNGTWLHFERDIAADVAAFNSGYTLTSIHGFFLNGSGSIDNLELVNGSPVGQNVYEDAEDNLSTRWRESSNLSGTATVTNIHSADRNSRVIEFTALNMSDGYIIGGFEGEAEAWNNTTGTMLKWDFKYNNRSSIYVRVETNDGPKFLYYGFGIADELSSNGRYIRHNLGDRPTNGTWLHFERDIAADVAAFNSGFTLTIINGFIVNGSGCIDNLSIDNNVGTPTNLLVNAGADKNVELGNSVLLSGSVSGGDGSLVTYIWKDENDNVLASTASFEYTPTQESTEGLTLTVTNATETAIDTVLVTAVNSVVQTQEIPLCQNKSAYISTLYTLGMTINSQTSHGSVLSDGNDFVAAVFCGAFAQANTSADVLNLLKNGAFPQATSILSNNNADGSIKAQYELTSINTQAYAVLKSILTAAGETDFSNYIDYSALATIKDLYIDVYVKYVNSTTSYIVVAVSDKIQNNSTQLNGLIDGKTINNSNVNNIETDAFIYSGNSLKSDILFVMDDSGSMANEQRAASDAIIRTFGTAMSSNGVDWKATVIGTERSRNYLFKHIDDPSENNISKLATQLLLGTRGGDEIGLKKAYDYLVAGDITVRNNSKLSIVLISDEVDHSRLSDFGVSDINNSYFVQNKITVNSIIVERPADLAYKMANATGGEIANLRNYATGYDAMMQSIANKAAGSASTIVLSRTPIIASIAVSVNGTVLATGWTYNSASNSIVFDAVTTPGSGASINVTYNY